MRVLSPLFVISLVLLMDLYVYHNLRRFFQHPKIWYKSAYFWAYWVISIGLLIGVLVGMNEYQKNPEDLDLFRAILSYNGVFIIAFSFKFLFSLIALVTDILKGLRSFFSKRNKEKQFKGKPISRASFIKKTGAVISMIPVLGIIHGIGWGRFKFTLHETKVAISNLPKSFEGFRIVQLSDAHLGSLGGHEDKIQDVIQQINDLDADILVFTGDMVNNFAHEMSGWVPIWKELKAKFGKYSVLGNHDYGSYSVWPSPNAKKKNLHEIIRQEREMGFDLLQNENRQITIGKESIHLAGVENWGSPPFPQYGDIDKALQGIPANSTTVLLSHDPDHFEYQIRGKKAVDLTLSGHTHGFQLGIEIGKFKISPVQLKYKRWAGLYQEQDQFLYVNRGFGYLAFPGRVGIWPEITLLELVRS